MEIYVDIDVLLCTTFNIIVYYNIQSVLICFKRETDVLTISQNGQYCKILLFF